MVAIAVSLQQFINLVHTRGSQVIEALDWDFVDELHEKSKKTRRGRPLIYPASQKLKGWMYGWAERKYSARQVTMELQGFMAARAAGFGERTPSYSTMNRFRPWVAEHAEGIFEEVVRQALELGITDGRELCNDTTPIRSRLRTDPDAGWHYDASREEFYWGYGLAVSACPYTHLPLRARFMKGNTPGEEEVLLLVGKTLELYPRVWLADSGFDMLKLHEKLLTQGVLPVVEYNPRSTIDVPNVKYRIELLRKRPRREELDELYGNRVEIEHAFSTLHEHFGLDGKAIFVRGFQQVKAHVFLALICRVAWAMAVYRRTGDPEEVRKSISAL